MIDSKPRNKSLKISLKRKMTKLNKTNKNNMKKKLNKSKIKFKRTC